MCSNKCSILFVDFLFSVDRLNKKLILALRRINRLKLKLRRARFDTRMKMKVSYFLRDRYV